MINLKEILHINKGDIISIVGSGGKTSLLFTLANELKSEFRVLLSTSAKIEKPPSDKYDYIYTNIDSYLNDKKPNNNGITVISKGINSKTNKLIGIKDGDLDLLLPYFDIVIIEADGSKELPLKGWKSHEPPVLEKTNKTVGVLPANLVNKKIKKDFIYGFEEFSNLTENSLYFNLETISKICCNKEGIFKNSKGSLYLFFNKADTNKEIELIKDLTKYLKESVVNKPFNFNICFGSMKKGIYYGD